MRDRRTQDEVAVQREREEALDRLLDEAATAERSRAMPDTSQFLGELRARIGSAGSTLRSPAPRRVRWSWAALVPLALVLYLFFAHESQAPVSVAEAEVMEILDLLAEGGDPDPELIESLAPATLDLLEDWDDVNDPDVLQLLLEDG